MSRRTLRQGLGAVAVAALFLLAAPVQAWVGSTEEGPSSWRRAWSAVVELWNDAREALGLHAAVAAAAIPVEEEPADDPLSRTGGPDKGDQGGAIDPDGVR